MESKIKLLKVLDILTQSDKNHPITASKICALLEKEGISAERKSVCRDINTLIKHGYKITLCHDNKLGYYMSEAKKEKAAPATAKTVKIELFFEEEDLARVEEIFGKCRERNQEAKTGIFNVEQTLLFTKLLTAGEFAKITSPEEIKDEFVQLMEKGLAFYKKPTREKPIEVWLL